MAQLKGLQVVKHTHGELGIAAAAAHHLLLTLPNIVDGNQQTAHMMQDDVLKGPYPSLPLPIGACREGLACALRWMRRRSGVITNCTASEGSFSLTMRR